MRNKSKIIELTRVFTKRNKTLCSVMFCFFVYMFLAPSQAWAMHIAEGILPMRWAVLWYLLMAPFLGYGIWRLTKVAKDDMAIKPLIGLLAAVVFIISAMPVPVPVAGSVSHPCGTGITAVLLGPGISVVVAAVALLLQALFLAHGGLSTLGGNVLSMGVLGSFAGFGTFIILRKFRVSLFISSFMAGLFADWATYVGTAFELTLGIRGDEDFMSLFLKIIVAFMPAQIPIGILEGFVTAGMINLLVKRRPDILVRLKILKPQEVSA